LRYYLTKLGETLHHRLNGLICSFPIPVFVHTLQLISNLSMI